MTNAYTRVMRAWAHACALAHAILKYIYLNYIIFALLNSLVGFASQIPRGFAGVIHHTGEGAFQGIPTYYAGKA